MAAFLPRLRAQAGEAHIVNTASMASLVALPHSSQMPRYIGAYTAIKHAVLGYTEMLRAELAPEGIGVSVLMAAGQVGPVVVAGIRANRLHIFTHPELRAAVEQRHQRVMKDFDFFAGSGTE